MSGCRSLSRKPPSWMKDGKCPIRLTAGGGPSGRKRSSRRSRSTFRAAPGRSVPWSCGSGIGDRTSTAACSSSSGAMLTTRGVSRPSRFIARWPPIPGGMASQGMRKALQQRLADRRLLLRPVGPQGAMNSRLGGVDHQRLAAQGMAVEFHHVLLPAASLDGRSAVRPEDHPAGLLEGRPQGMHDGPLAAHAEQAGGEGDHLQPGEELVVADFAGRAPGEAVDEEAAEVGRKGWRGRAWPESSSAVTPRPPKIAPYHRDQPSRNEVRAVFPSRAVDEAPGAARWSICSRWRRAASNRRPIAGAPSGKTRASSRSAAPESW